MRDSKLKLQSGDISLDSSGNAVILENADAKFQQAAMRVAAKAGCFIYDRGFGSKIFTDDSASELSDGQMRLYANEALAGLENTFAEVSKAADGSLKITLTIDGETREVLINGSV